MNKFWELLGRGVEATFEGMVASYTPLEWPIWARRIFLLTIPVSGPAWVCWIILFSLILLALFACIWIVVKVMKFVVLFWTNDPEWHAWVRKVDYELGSLD